MRSTGPIRNLKGLFCSSTNLEETPEQLKLHAKDLLENKKHTYCDTLQSHQPKIKGMTITLQVDVLYAVCVFIHPNSHTTGYA